MHVIRTAEEMARALSSQPDPMLRERLLLYQSINQQYPDHTFEELGEFAIVQPGDTLDDVCRMASGEPFSGGGFGLGPEVIERHGDWLELVFIYSDDGFGLVLFVPLQPDIDPDIIGLCKVEAPNLDLSSDR